MWAAAWLTQGCGCLGNAHETIQLGDNPNSLDPCVVIHVKLTEESRGDFANELRVRFLSLLELANKVRQLGEVPPLQVLGSRHLTPVCRDFGCPRRFHLIDLLPNVRVL